MMNMRKFKLPAFPYDNVIVGLVKVALFLIQPPLTPSKNYLQTI